MTQYPENIENDPRLGKRARVNRTGEVGVISEVSRFADGYELIELKLGKGMRAGALRPDKITILDDEPDAEAK